MTTAVSRSTPPQRLVTFFNPVVCAVLQSPFHRVVDSAVIILHITGRRTARRYDIPVGYVDLNGRFVVITQHTWRANLRGGADIEVTHDGRRAVMHADLDEDPGSVAAILHAVIERIGWRAARRQLGLTINVGRIPSIAEIEQAVSEYGLATVTLTG